MCASAGPCSNATASPARSSAGAQALNEANGSANTADEGRHETVTIAWLRLIEAARRERAAALP